MAHYIDKSALVAEIERRVKEGEEVVKEIPSSAIMGLIQAYKNTLSFIDTLEVKEVDLDDQDIYSILYLERMVMRDFGDKEYSHEELCQEVLKRFKAQKGEEV